MPSIRSITHALGLASLTLAAFGCDDGSEPTFRERKCDEICARYEMCNDETDVTDCKSDCSAEAFRSDKFFEIKTSCVQELSCNRLTDRDQSTALNDCIGDALREEKLGASAVTLCEALANKLADCPVDADPDTVQSECESIAITLSQAYLDGSEQCSTERCADISACFTELADTYDTSVKIYAGSTAE